MADALVRYEILGALRAFRDGHELDLGPGKQRTVLAALLVNANRAVSTTRIVDAVWPYEPPENGSNVVQKYVGGLRKALEPDRSPRAQGRLLQRTEAGYLLRVKPGCLDAALFRERVVSARAALARGQAADASVWLSGALELWRGEPLADLTGPFFEAEAAHLVEDRADACEAWAEAELELGRHDRLVPELSRLVAAFPARERLRYLQILALYRCGRQVDALEAYRFARTLLAEEYGVEPGPELRELHQAVLRNDPALAAPLRPVPLPEGALIDPVATSAPVHVHAWAPPDSVATSAPPAYNGWSSTRPVATPPPPGWWADPGWSYGPGQAGLLTSNPGRWRWLTSAAMVGVPLVTIGMATWVVFALLAAYRRSRVIAVCALLYAALFTFGFVTTDTSASVDAPASLLENLGDVGWLIAMLGGAVHGAVIIIWSGPKRR